MKKIMKGLTLAAVFIFFLLTALPAYKCYGINLAGHYAEGMTFDVSVHNGYLYAATGCMVKIYDIRDTSIIAKLNWKTNPVGTIYAKYLVNGIDFQGNYIYIASNKDLVIADISNPNGPKIVANWAYQSTYPSYAVYADVKARGNFAYLSAGGPKHELIILNISNPSNPSEAGTWGPGYASTGGRLDVLGNYAYIGEGKTMHIVNVSNPSACILSGSWVSPAGRVSSVAVKDQNTVLLAEYHWGAWAINVSNPSNPVVSDNIRGAVLDEVNASDIKILGNYAYLSTRYEGFRIINISNPQNLITTGISSTTYGMGYTEGICPMQNFVFTTQSSRGVDAWRASSLAKPYQIGHIACLGEVNCLKLVGNYLYVGPRNGGIWVMDVTDPANPKRVNYLESMQGRYYSIARQGNYLYLLGAWGSMNIIDVTDPVNPKEVLEDWGPGATGGVGSMFVEGNYAFYNTDNGFRIVNVASPSVPQLVYQGTIPAYGIARYGTKYLVISSDAANGLVIFDISNINSPVKVGSYPNNYYWKPVVVSGNTAFSGWGNCFQSYNIASPSQPVSLDSLCYSGSWSVMDITLSGKYAYCTGNHLKIFDITDPSNLIVAEENKTLPVSSGDGEIQNGYWYITGGDHGFYIYNISTATGIPVQTNATDMKVKVFPNPTADEFTISAIFPETDEVKFVLKDIVGKALISWQDVSVDKYYQKTVSMYECPAGIYFLEIISGYNHFMKKVIKQ